MEPFFINNKLKLNYSEYYDGGSQWRWLGAIDKANNIIKLCNQYPHENILEIGAGEGSILKRLSDLKFGNSLYALEISESGIEVIRQKNIRNLVDCKIFDGYNIPYEDDKFDLAILSHVVEHLEYPRKMLYEAIRVAKYLFVEVPLEDNMRMKADFIFDKVRHINFYSYKTIRRLLQSCGLQILAQEINNSSYRVYQYQYGSKAFLRYIPKQLLIKIMPNIATKIFVYHCSLLCMSDSYEL